MSGPNLAETKQFENQERIICLLGFAHLAPVGIGVKAVVADHDLYKSISQCLTLDPDLSCYQRPGMSLYLVFKVYSLYPSSFSNSSFSSSLMRGTKINRKNTVGIIAQ